MSGRVYLTGFMGCGKSTVAPLLARLLGFHSVDIDSMIEHGTGKTVPEIFAADGEAEFRALERAALLETVKMDHVVVSLGGGTLSFRGNDRIVKSSGMLIYLKVDFETLFKRVRGKDDRPLLRVPPGGRPGAEALRGTMERLFTERVPFYERADLSIDPGNRDPEAVAEVIAAALRGEPDRIDSRNPI